MQRNFFFRFLRPFTSKLGRKALYSIRRFAPPVCLIVSSAYVRKFLLELGKRGRTNNFDLVFPKLEKTFPDMYVGKPRRQALIRSAGCDDRNMTSSPPCHVRKKRPE